MESLVTYLGDRRLGLALESEERRGSTRRDSAEAAERRVSEPHRGVRAQRTLTAAEEEESSSRRVGERQCRLRGVLVVTGVQRAARQVAVAGGAPECLGMLAVLSANPRATRLARNSNGGRWRERRAEPARGRGEGVVVREVVMTRKRWWWCDGDGSKEREREVVVVVVVRMDSRAAAHRHKPGSSLSRAPTHACPRLLLPLSHLSPLTSSALGARLFSPSANARWSARSLEPATG